MESKAILIFSLANENIVFSNVSWVQRPIRLVKHNKVTINLRLLGNASKIYNIFVMNVECKYNVKMRQEIKILSSGNNDNEIETKKLIV